MTDKELLELLRKDDSSAFEPIFSQLHTPLCKLAFHIVKDPEQAKDIVQEVVIRLWRMRHDLAIRESLLSYLRKAVVNTALNFLEHNRRFARQLFEGDGPPQFISNPTDEQISYRELEQKANQAIENLPARTRIVFTLIRSEEMTYKEVAGSLHISTKAVEKEMMKALKLMREALKDYLHIALIIALAQGF
jgi:RNA polymerase sigma-70 factor (ECF subfamily)